MNIEREQKDDFISTIKITLSPEDYASKFDAKLKTLKSQVNMKGFRKGKTPEHLVKKMYGSATFSEILDQIFNNNLRDYLSNNNIQHLAQPLLSEGQKQLNVDYTAKDTVYELSFDINEINDFEIGGLDTNQEYDLFKPIIDDKTIEEELDNMSKRFGQMVEVNEVGDNDNFEATAIELEDGKPKSEGIETKVKLFTFSIHDADLKNHILTLKKGDKFTTQLQKIEDKDMAYLKKNLLKISPEDEREVGDTFEFTIDKIERLQPAEITDEFVKEHLVELGVENIEDARIKLKEAIESYYVPTSEALLFRNVMETMMKSTNISVSKTFMKRWMKETENLSDEKIEQEHQVLMDELKWTTIKDHLAKKYNIEVSNDEIQNQLYQKVLSYQRQYGYFDKGITQRLYEILSKDQNEMYNAYNMVKTNKLFTSLKPTLMTKEVNLSIEDFQKKVDEINSKSANN